MKNIFFPIVISLIFINIKTYLENKKKFISIFDRISIVTHKIENIEKIINRKCVQFNDNKEIIDRKTELSLELISNSSEEN